MPDRPRLAITAGEPAGIGVDLLCQLASHCYDAECVLFTDVDCLKARAQQLNLELSVQAFDHDNPVFHRPGRWIVEHVPLKRSCQPGVLDPENAQQTLAALDHALKACQTKRFDALVTGPLHKAVLNQAGIAFTGHTEYCRDACGAAATLMLFDAPGMQVALATTHCPLRAVAEQITQERVSSCLQLLDQYFQKRQQKAQIAVCGLNPHAGENGYLGHEEIDIIIPAITACQAQGIKVSGPFPADSLFSPKKRQSWDVILAMYHDQGLPVVKSHHFSDAVNITLGLPFLRTSVDHGVALDLVGKGQADPTSFDRALKLAITAVTKHD